MKQQRMSAGVLVRGKEGKSSGGVRMCGRETLPPALQEVSCLSCSPARRKKLAGVKGPGFPVVSSPLRPFLSLRLPTGKVESIIATLLGNVFWGSNNMTYIRCLALC